MLAVTGLSIRRLITGLQSTRGDRTLRNACPDLLIIREGGSKFDVKLAV